MGLQALSPTPRANRQLDARGGLGVLADGVDGRGDEARYRVTIPKAQFADAAEVLHQQGLPRAAAQGEDSHGGIATLMPNQSLDSVIALRAHAADVERALLSLDGVVDARVLLSMEDAGDLGATLGLKAPHAALVLRCRELGAERGCGITENGARSVLMTALPGLTAENTAVVLQSVSPLAADSSGPALENVLGIPVLASAAATLRLVLGGFAAVVLLLAAFSMRLVAQRPVRA